MARASSWSPRSQGSRIRQPSAAHGQGRCWNRDLDSGADEILPLIWATLVTNPTIFTLLSIIIAFLFGVPRRSIAFSHPSSGIHADKLVTNKYPSPCRAVRGCAKSIGAGVAAITWISGSALLPGTEELRVRAARGHRQLFQPAQRAPVVAMSTCRPSDTRTGALATGVAEESAGRSATRSRCIQPSGRKRTPARWIGRSTSSAAFRSRIRPRPARRPLRCCSITSCSTKAAASARARWAGSRNGSTIPRNPPRSRIASMRCSRILPTRPRLNRRTILRWPASCHRR